MDLSSSRGETSWTDLFLQRSEQPDPGRPSESHAASLGLTVVERTVSSVNDIQQAAESMVGQVDFIYVPTDNVIASSIPTLVKVTDPAKILYS